MKSKNVFAIILALLAAVMYAISVPFSKLLLDGITPAMLSAFLYLGAGFGTGALFLITYKKKEKASEPFFKKDIPYIICMIVFDIIATICFMYGLSKFGSSGTSLLNNFEIVATALIAMILFKEVVSKKMWIAIVLITISSFILSFEDIKTFKFNFGAILVLIATICWAFENNCTNKLSNKNRYKVVMIDGLGAGIGCLIFALITGESFPSFFLIALNLLLGFVSYGLSIVIYIKSQSMLGASKTSAYYSVNPFIASFLSFIFIPSEKLGLNYFIGLFFMIIGTVIVVIDTLKPINKINNKKRISAKK